MGLAKKGVQVFPPPGVSDKMDAKAAISKISDLTVGPGMEKASCGRALEGDLKFLMVGNTCLGVVHTAPPADPSEEGIEQKPTVKFYDNSCLSKLPLGTLTFDAFVNKTPGADGKRHRVAPIDGPKKLVARECTKETVT